MVEKGLGIPGESLGEPISRFTPQLRALPNRSYCRAEARKQLWPLKTTLELRPPGHNLRISGGFFSRLSSPL